MSSPSISGFPTPDAAGRPLPQTLKLGPLLLDAPFYQASLSGYSDYAMREVARRFAAPLTFAGVMLDKAAVHPKAARKPAFACGSDESPVGAQIMGSEPGQMAAAARALQAMGYDVIDVNLACPAPKVLRRGRGGALLQATRPATDIIAAVRAVVRGPMLIKLRAAYDAGALYEDVFWNICEHAVREGVDALVVHGRTVLQRYRGKGDWAVPAAVKQRWPGLTVVGSGDIFDAASVVERLRETGIDGVLLARGVVGNPWLFREARALVRGEPLPAAPTLPEQGAVIAEHWRMVQALYAERKAVGLFRKFLVRYSQRHPQRKSVNVAMLAAQTSAEVDAGVRHWWLEVP